MDKTNYISPEFGPLRGIRVIGAGSLIAMPFAATMMADFGAEVIQIERPRIGDTYRTFPPFKTTEQGTAGSSWIQDARNRLSMTLELDLSDPDVKEIFYKLIARSDIFIENMVWLEKLGIDDKELLKINPRLIIVHISGYGHKEFGGKPEICDQASYDMTGQAYSGYALFNGYPEKDPLIVKPSLGDYITALFALFGMLAAYIDAKNTGHGQVVDVAQFESMARVMRDAFTMSSLGLAEVQRCGTKAIGFQPYDLFKSSDGVHVSIGAVGKVVFERFMNAAGFDLEKYPYEKTSKNKEAVNSPEGRELGRLINEWCRSHTADEIEEAMRRGRVPCARVNDAQACMHNEHFLDRGDFVSFVDQTLGIDVTAFGIAPKMSRSPGMVWRGGPRLGQDTDEILKTVLGYGDDDIAAFRKKGII